MWGAIDQQLLYRQNHSMKHYLLKKLVNGYKLGPEYKGLSLIATPFKYKDEKIQVEYSKDTMIIDKDTPLLDQREFPDKFGRDKRYTLYYYQWKPNQNQTKLEL